MIYISTTITENTTLLIDEPENSLHPKWQKNYIKILVDLFYLYQPKIVIATHSALIVTGSEITNSSTKVYKSSGFSFYKKENDPINIEDAFIGYFDVITPQNRVLSRLLIDMLNHLADGKLTTDNLNILLDNLEQDVYQPDQIRLLEGVKEIAKQIIDTPRNNGSENLN